MAEYKAPLRDMLFVLNELFGAERIWQAMPGTSELTAEDASMILEEGAKICEKELYPINRSGDEEGCRVEGDQVITPAGFKEAYKTFAEGGWSGLGGNPEYGGQGMPKMLTLLFEEMMFAANSSFTLYPSLCYGACLAIDKHASEALKQAYLPKLYEGIWTGTMCLTEPHSGTDLGIIRTKAEPNDDGSYKISGTKIFITGGEHDLAENIIHMVLAKLPDAPAGSKGISLFLIPKFTLNNDGSVGERNAVSVGSIEHKMGIKASSTCVMNFDGATGWMVGEPNNGLAAMFTMMNYERLTIGLQGIGTGDMAYQHAVDYARERIQGRSATGVKAPEKAADPIIVHADVRRMLLTMRALTEAGRAFGMYVAQSLDIAKYHADEAERQRAEQLIALLTPVAKAFFTDRGLESAVAGQQVFGGHGYIREWGAEQLVRDVRIAQIYEGTNGIQALDLMGRKTVRTKGELLKVFVADVEAFMSEANSDTMAEFITPLERGITMLSEMTEFVVEQAESDSDIISAVAVDYLDLFGYVAYAFMWAKMVYVSLPNLEGGEADFYQSKLKLARFYLSRIFPRTEALVSFIKDGANSTMAFPEAMF